MPKLSIIVPVYNTGKYIEKCLNSLVNQTLDDIEIIIVNDGSTDNSASIINRFHEKYPHKIINLTKKNGGLSDARNYGINYVSSEYVGFVDSDDFVETTMFEELYYLATKENLDFVECDFSWDFPKKHKKDIGKIYTKIEDYYLYGRVLACNKLYKTSIIKKYNLLFPNNLLYEDVEFFYKFIPYTQKSGKVNKVLYHYVQRKNSIINSNGEKTSDIFIILENIVNYYKKENLYEVYVFYLEYLYVRILLGSSFLRILKINNKKIRKALLVRTYYELNLKFPKWKNNIYLNKYKNKKNRYYKSVNKFTFKLYSYLFRLF